MNGALSYTLSDGLGSVSESVSASTGTVSATQLYGPYGAARYTSGTLPTDYAFTHQRADATSGLDYYGARYYDPVAGQFSSADSVQAGGLNRYAYVGGNPETATDPSGHLLVNSGARNTSDATLSHEQQAAPVQVYVNQWAAPCDWGCTAGVIGQVVLGTDTLRQSYQTLVDPHASGWDKVKAGGVGLFTLGMDTVSIVSIFTVQPEGVEGARAAELAVASAADLDHVGLVSTDAGGTGVFSDAKVICGGESFTPDTRVATPHGEQPIASIHVGDRVTAYDPTTGKTKTQTVKRVFLNHDSDRLDVTLAHASVHNTTTSQGTQDTTNLQGPGTDALCQAVIRWPQA